MSWEVERKFCNNANFKLDYWKKYQTEFHLSHWDFRKRGIKGKKIKDYAVRIYKDENYKDESGS